MSNKFLRLPEVMKLTGMSRPTIYLRISKNQFPRQTKNGRISVWLEADIDAWIDQQVAASRVGGAA